MSLVDYFLYFFLLQGAALFSRLWSRKTSWISVGGTELNCGYFFLFSIFSISEDLKNAFFYLLGFGTALFLDTPWNVGKGQDTVTGDTVLLYFWGHLALLIAMYNYRQTKLLFLYIWVCFRDVIWMLLCCQQTDFRKLLDGCFGLFLDFFLFTFFVCWLTSFHVYFIV